MFGGTLNKKGGVPPMAISKDKKRMQITISKTLAKKLDEQSKSDDKTKSEIIEMALKLMENTKQKMDGK